MLGTLEGTRLTELEVRETQRSVEKRTCFCELAIRKASKRSDAESIFKFISTNNASNFTMSDIVDALDKLKQKGKIENKQTKNGLDLFFLVGDQSYIDNSFNQDTDQSEPSKDKRKNITVNISVETCKTKDAKAPIKLDKIDEFTVLNLN